MRKHNLQLVLPMLRQPRVVEMPDRQQRFTSVKRAAERIDLNELSDIIADARQFRRFMLHEMNERSHLIRARSQTIFFLPKISMPGINKCPSKKPPLRYALPPYPRTGAYGGAARCSGCGSSVSCVIQIGSYSTLYAAVPHTAVMTTDPVIQDSRPHAGETPAHPATVVRRAACAADNRRDARAPGTCCHVSSNDNLRIQQDTLTAYP